MSSSDLFSMLVAQTCQVSILFLFVWLLVRTVAKQRPHLAHALWALVLIKCLTPPIISSPVSPFSWMASDNSSPQIVALNLQQRQELPAVTPRGLHDQRIDDSVVAYARPLEEIAETEPNRDSKSPLRGLGTWSLAENHSIEPSQIPSTPTVGWRTIVVFAWLGGALIALSMVGIRMLWFVRWLNRCQTIECTNTRRTLNRLCQELNFKRPVRLRLLDSPVGPAVYGLLRPTILLPHSLVVDKDTHDLQPLLAHELIHIRRGDLWWAAVQSIARCLFWFHPLIHWAARMVTWESERSCDEETVASLGCRASDYALQLIEVLEHKHKLRVAPALPGVRPVDITSARLERVMKFGNGIHHRRPFWVWIVLIVGCSISLPGAALVFGQQKQPQEWVQENATAAQPLPPAQGQAVPLQQQLPLVNDAQKVKPKQWRPKIYRIDEVVRKYNKSKARHDSSLISLLGHREVPKGVSSTPNGEECIFKLRKGEFRLGNQRPNMKLVDNCLLVIGDDEIHNLVKQKIDRYTKFGFDVVSVETRILKMPVDELGKLGVDWSVASIMGKDILSVATDGQHYVVNPPEDSSLHSAEPIGATWAGQLNASLDDSTKNRLHHPAKVAAVSYVEQSSPVLHATLDRQQTEAFLNQCKSNGLISISQSPIVVMNNGQDASIYSGMERPFVVGLKKAKSKDEAGDHVAYQPIVQVFQEGTSIKLNATIQKSTEQAGVPVLEDVPYVGRVYRNVTSTTEIINLACRMEQSELLKVDTVAIPLQKTNSKDFPKIQMPKVATTRIQSTLPVKAGETLVLTGIQETKDGKKEAFVALMTCYLPYSENEEVRFPKPRNNEAKDPQGTKSSAAQSYKPPQPTRLLPVVSEQMVDGKLTTVHYSVAEQDYRIKGGEILGVVVQGVLDPNGKAGVPQPVALPELGYPVAVDTEGNISLPLLDKFSVKQKTPSQIKTEIRRRYAEAKILANAQVIVRIRETFKQKEVKPQVIRIKGKTLSDSSEKRDYQPLFDVLKEQNVELKIEGDVEFKTDGNANFTLQGAQLSIDAGDEFKVSGAHGRMEVSNNTDMSVHFDGDVKMHYANLHIHADQVTFGQGENSEFEIDLKGNAHLVTVEDSDENERWDMKADHIYYDDPTERLILLGNVKFIRYPKEANAEGEKAKTYEGQRIEFDATSQKVRVIK